MSLFNPSHSKMPELYKKWNLAILDKLCLGCIIIEEEEDVKFLDDTIRQTSES